MSEPAAMSEILERFQRVQRDTPGRILVHARSEGREIPASQIWLQAGVVGAALASSGLGRDHLVVSMAGNRSGFYPLVLGCLSRGVALLPVDRGATATELVDVVTRFGASAIVLPQGTPSGELPVRHAVTLPGELELLILREAKPAPDTYSGAAVLKLTSGSTGLPKATFTTEQHLLLDSLHIIEGMGIRPEDTQLGLIPLSHAYGIGSLVVPLFLQGTAIVLRETFVPSLVMDDAVRHQARVFPGVPFMFERVLAHLRADAWPRSLETLISAGAPLDVGTARDFASRFGVKIHTFYGTTETGGICYDASDEVRGRPTVGAPLPGVTVSLRDEPDAPEGAGRVHVAGEAVTCGYVGGTESDRASFTDEGYLTGDLGRFEGGRLSLVGRVSEFINVAGRKVQPNEVERVLHERPDVAGVRVIGLPDTRRGQKLVACVVVRGAVPSAYDLRRYCAARLAPHKIPRDFVFVEAFPHDARGKTSRQALEALVADRLRE